MAEIKRGSYEYNKAYAEKYLAQFRKYMLRLTYDEYDRLAELAEKSGKSINQYIKDCIFREG